MSNVNEREPLQVVVYLFEPDGSEAGPAVAIVELENADPDNRQLHLKPLGDPDRTTTVTLSEAAARVICAQLLPESGSDA